MGTGQVKIDEFFSQLELAEPPEGLFDKITFEIRKQKSRYRRKLVLELLFLLIISFISVPFSWILFINQARDSGIVYFISAAVNDLTVFFALWRDFGLVIVDSLPIGGITAVLLSLAIFLFTLRLFLYKKRFLFGCLAHKYGG